MFFKYLFLFLFNLCNKTTDIFLKFFFIYLFFLFISHKYRHKWRPRVGSGHRGYRVAYVQGM